MDKDFDSNGGINKKDTVNEVPSYLSVLVRVVRSITDQETKIDK